MKFSLRALLLFTAFVATVSWQATKPHMDFIPFLSLGLVVGLCGGWICYRVVEWFLSDDAE